MFTDDSFEKKGFDTETFEADSNNCFICSKPANNQRGVNVKTQPRIDNKDGDLWLCDEHNNLFDFGLFANGNLLAWTHPNGTEYMDKGEFSKRLKNAESDKLHGWATNMLRDVKDLIEDLENGAVYDLDDCRERLEKIRDDTSHLNAEDFDNKSNPIKKYCLGCGTPRKLEKLPYQVGVDGTQAYSCGDCYEDVREAETFEAKGIDTLAEPFEEMGISKPYARLGVIAAGITALAFGVNKIRK